jgi:amidase
LKHPGTETNKVFLLLFVHKKKFFLPGILMHYLDLLELSRLLHAREVSPVEVTQAQLDRIAALNPVLHAYAAVMADSAMGAARVAEAEIAAGNIRGPLHGVPVAVKDLFWTRDAPTAAGGTIHAGFRAPEDATVVRRLREAGAVILGKLQMTEGAYAAHHPSVTPPVNPWGVGQWTGTSSSGSGVAVAAGLCYAALGTDTGGSIRFPSAANGITGIKPSWGRVSRHGMFDLAPSLDHIGPMARSAADAAAVLRVIAGVDARDPTASARPVPDYLGVAPGLKGVRLGIDARWNGDGADDATLATLAAAEDVLTGLGAVPVRVKFPDTVEMVRDWYGISAMEAAAAHAGTFPARAGEYGPVLAQLLGQAAGFSAEDYQGMVQRRAVFKARVAEVFAGVDLLLAPVQFPAAPSLAEMAMLRGQKALQGLMQFAASFDMTGQPTMTLPGGFTPAGMPVGFQLVARVWGEAGLVRAGMAFQGVTDWHRRRAGGG